MDGTSASTRGVSYRADLYGRYLSLYQQGASVTAQICMDGTSASNNKGRQLQRRSVWTVPQPPTTRGVSYSADLYGRYLSLNKGRQLQSRSVWTVPQSPTTRGVSYSADLYGRYLSLLQQGASVTEQICMDGTSVSYNKGRQLQRRSVWTVAQPLSTRGVSYSADLYGRYLSLYQQGASVTAQICMEGTSATNNKGRQLQRRSVWTVPQPQQGASVTEQICMDGTSASINKGRQLQRRSVWAVAQPPTTRGVSYSADLYGR